MTNQMKKAILRVLDDWSKLDDEHKGKYYEEAKAHLQRWLDEDTSDNT